MGGNRLTPAQKARIGRLRFEGHTFRDIANAIGVGENTVYRTIAAAKAKAAADGHPDWVQYLANSHNPSPNKAPSFDPKLPPGARQALDDVVYFSKRYFGILLHPWQDEAARTVVELLASPDEEYLVINAPPGSGKSTFFTHILACWLIARDRTLRGLIGSASQSVAELYLKRIRMALTTTTPFRARPADIQTGRAVDAVACLCVDYGPFKPEERSGLTWSSDAISVIPPLGMPPTEKENTLVTYGRSRGFLGNRVDWQIWDDVYDPSQVRTPEARDELRSWWDTHVESRVEPGGLLVLQGQRLGADDLYRHALDKTGHDNEDEDAPDSSVKGGKYRHILYKAHYTDKCTGRHRPGTVKPYPDGCLLAPNRLSWKRLAAIQRDDPITFAVLYQQDDTPKGHVLVHPLWIEGGQDPETKERFPGCWDLERDQWQLPQGLRGPSFMAVSVDPSPTKWWSAQLWTFYQDSTFRYLLAHHRAKMSAPDLLDWDELTGQWTGLMEDWQTKAEQLGWPLTHWIIEQNAAARYLLQYQNVHRWKAKHSVSIIGHDTTSTNKSDIKLGVGTIGPNYRHGRARLPGLPNSEGRRTAQFLVDELTKYPDGRTDDTVLANWFFEYNLPKLHRPNNGQPTVLQRPSWLSSLPDPRKALAS